MAVSHVARNVTAVLAAVLAAYLALAIAATIDGNLAYPREFSTVAGELFMRLTGLVPFLVAAAVLGAVAASIARPARRGPWLIAVFILAAAQYALSFQYIAPQWQEWLIAIVSGALIGAAAVGGFWLVGRRTGTSGISRTAAASAG